MKVEISAMELPILLTGGKKEKAKKGKARPKWTLTSLGTAFTPAALWDHLQ